MSERPFISQFTPQRTDPEALEQILVQRHDLLARSVEKLRESVLSKNKHHLLFIGPRGAGKSHLVTLIHHRLSGQEDLAPRMRFAWLNEDETSTSFLSLLLRIYRNLSDRYPEEFPSDALEAIRGKDPASARKILGAALLHHLGDRTIVLIFENLDSLFDHMNEGEQRTWRGFIQNHPVFATCATAQSLFGGVSKRNEPFFGFFDTAHLKNLSIEEATELLEKIAALNGQPELVDFLRTPTGWARLRAVHHLSGGNPRLYIILSDFLTKESLDNLVRPFEDVVDRQLTSYYQERMRSLTPQQREIVQLLCREGHPTPVKDIAAGLFVPHGSVTNQLKQLRGMGYLVTHPRGREVYYELAEPLMRLSFQVKETNDREPLALIVDFLRIWYDRKELEKRLSKFSPEAEGRAYFEAALKKLNSEGVSFRHELMRRGLDEIDLENCDSKTYKLLKGIAEDTGDPEDWSRYADASYYRKNFNEAIVAFSKLLKFPGLPTEIKTGILINRAISLGHIGQVKAEESDYTKIIKIKEAPAEDLSIALVNRALSRENRGHLKGALQDYTTLIKLTDAPQRFRAKAFHRRGAILWQNGNFSDAIVDLTEAIEMKGSPAKTVLSALFARSSCYYDLGIIGKSISDAITLIHHQDADPDSKARGYYAYHWILLSSDSFSESISAFSHFLDIEESEVIPDTLSRYPSMVAEGLIKAAFGIARKGEDWTRKLRPVIQKLGAHGSFEEIGQGLIKHLDTLRQNSSEFNIHNEWVTSWEQLTRNHEEMTIPLRMLRAGVEWIKTKDEGSLLTLVKEERSIVRQALGLPEEEG
jgi:tetratricopeptide (TPR) repeat protein